MGGEGSAQQSMQSSTLLEVIFDLGHIPFHLRAFFSYPTMSAMETVGTWNVHVPWEGE